jgi:hypothetical protein
MYVGRKAVKYGTRYVARRARRRARDSVRRGAQARVGPMPAMLLVGLGAVLGIVLGWLADPRRRRRAVRAGNVARGAAAHATAPVRDAFKEQPDDATLARMVETEIFRPADAPKGSVDVNAEHGVVYLRGQVESPEAIASLVRDAEKVRGVRAVQSLLHLPGTPAPSKDDARAGSGNHP